MNRTSHENPHASQRDAPHSANSVSPTHLQNLLSDLSSHFIHHNGPDSHQLFETAQRMVCDALHLDRSTLWLFSDDGSEMALYSYWQQEGCPPLRRNFVTRGNLPWADAQIRSGIPLQFSSLDELPPQADRDREVLQQHGTRANVTFPLFLRGKVSGALAFAMTHAERNWTDEEVAALELVSRLFCHAIGTSRAEEHARQLQDEIQRAYRSAQLGELATSLVHEINQPLTSILANAQAARRFLLQDSADPREILAILDDIIHADKQVAELIHNLRDMLGDKPSHTEHLCLNELVKTICATFAKDLRHEGIELIFTPAENQPIRIHAARVEIQQLLANLITNANQAMCDTPVNHRRIHIGTHATGGKIHLHVRDHGHGIPTEHLDRIFKPFHSTRKEGLGIGLALCRRIAERHGGTLTATNHTGGGALLTLSLPLHTQDGMGPWSDGHRGS